MDHTPLTTTSEPPMPSWVLMWTLALAGFLTYSNTFFNTLLWDDELLIQNNVYLTKWDYLGSLLRFNTTRGSGGVDLFYRPIQGLLYFFVYRFGGVHPFGYHLLNILIHIFNGLCVYVGVKYLSQKNICAFWVALLWLLHPAHTEAITYISGTADPLATCFIFVGLFAWHVGLGRTSNPPGSLHKGYLLLAGLAYIGGLLSKESALIFPGLAFLERWATGALHSTSGRVRTIQGLALLCLISACYLGLRATWFNFKDTYQFYPQPNIYTEHILVRVYTFIVALGEYAKILLWPYDLRMERLLPIYPSGLAPAVWQPAIAICLLFVGILLSFKRFKPSAPSPMVIPWSVGGMGWFCVCFIPMSGVFLPVNSLLLEHWLYLPSVGCFAWWVHTLLTKGCPPGKAPIGLFICGLCALFFAMRTYRQSLYWQDPISFYEHILAYDQSSPRIQNNLGMAYASHGRIQEAVTAYEQAIRLSDIYPQTRFNLGVLCFHQKRFDLAEVHLKRSIELNPLFFQSHQALFQLYNALGLNEQAHVHKTLYETLVKNLVEHPSQTQITP